MSPDLNLDADKVASVCPYCQEVYFEHNPHVYPSSCIRKLKDDIYLLAQQIERLMHNGNRR